MHVSVWILVLWNCEWLIISVMVSSALNIYMDNCGNSRANTRFHTQLCRRVAVIRYRTFIGFAFWRMTHCNHVDRTTLVCDVPFKFLTYQLRTVGYWPTVAMTGNGELGFDSGEGAWETATTSKEGSRRANYPILTLSLIHIWRCRRLLTCRSRWSPYH